jgi:hypothetical protein
MHQDLSAAATDTASRDRAQGGRNGTSSTGQAGENPVLRSCHRFPHRATHRGQPTQPPLPGCPPYVRRGGRRHVGARIIPSPSPPPPPARRLQARGMTHAPLTLSQHPARTRARPRVGAHAQEPSARGTQTLPSQLTVQVPSHRPRPASHPRPPRRLPLEPRPHRARRQRRAARTRRPTWQALQARKTVCKHAQGVVVSCGRRKRARRQGQRPPTRASADGRGAMHGKRGAALAWHGPMHGGLALCAHTPRPARGHSRARAEVRKRGGVQARRRAHTLATTDLPSNLRPCNFSLAVLADATSLKATKILPMCSSAGVAGSLGGCGTGMTHATTSPNLVHSSICRVCRTSVLCVPALGAQGI